MNLGANQGARDANEEIWRDKLYSVLISIDERLCDIKKILQDFTDKEATDDKEGV